MELARLRFVVGLCWLGACGGGKGLSDFYPDLPPETGGPQQAFAGQVTDAAELLAGPAQSGLVGDFFIKNDRVSFIVQAPTRVIGVIPQGGNVVDAALTDGTRQTVDDHFGELALIYLLGRTCEPDKIEIVRDGKKGGVAVLRAVGKSGNNDFLNLKGIGLLTVTPDVDPVIEDGVLCATTYILAPGSTTLEVHHSLFNDSDDAIAGPLGTVADTGGHTEAWSNARGFARADLASVLTLADPQPMDYVVYQGPGVAYGVIPRHDAPTVHAQANVSGVSLLLNNAESIFDVLKPEKYFLRLGAGAGVRQAYDLAVGKDGVEIDEVFRARNGETLRAISGRAEFSGGGPALGGRVGVFSDGNGNGVLDGPDVDLDFDKQPDDKIISYMDVAADGTFRGNVPTAAGNLFVRAEVKNVGRSQDMPATDTVILTVPSPIRVDYRILDEATGQPIPGRLLVVGDHAAFPDARVFETTDRTEGVVTQLHAIRGTSVGAGADEALFLPGGTQYRIYASRGTEWSMASQPVAGTGPVTLEFRLMQVNPTPGYLATDWHVHQIGSPDSNVLSEERVRSAVSAGVEMFAVTDHDYVSDLQPIVERLGLQDRLRVLPGIEVTPFAYGHFNSWPLEPDLDSPNRGAIDWARGAREGFAMTPGEIYDAMRARGGQMVQVNHPRGAGFTAFQGAFTRANVKYDYAGHTIYGDFQGADLPNEFLRLPGESLWSDRFNGLEVWNGFLMDDTNDDGRREFITLEPVMRDWLSMLSLGLFVTPAGNSDTHTVVLEPVGMPRTYVRVPDDSAGALASDAAEGAVLATQTGANNTPRDLVVTNGPMITVTATGAPALGRVFQPNGLMGKMSLDVTVTSPDWAEFDTLEVFANTTPDPIGADGDITLVPLQCFTSRDPVAMPTNDPCKRAPLGVTQLNGATQISLQSVGNQALGYRRFILSINVALDADQIGTRAGAIGKDAWIVFRVRGDTAIFPVHPFDAISLATRDAILAGNPDQIRAALKGKGVPVTAFTTPVFVDFDGGGYRAPFAP